VLRLPGSFVLGAVAVAGYAPLQLYPLPILCLAALLLQWHRAPTARAAAMTGFAFGLGMFLAGVSWVYVSLHTYGGMAVPLAAAFTLLFCVYLACYPAAVGAVLWRVAAPPPAKFLLLFPALWATSEWLRGWLLSGFPWLAVGYSQVPASPLAGYGPVLGVFGISLASAAVAGAFGWAVRSVLARKRIALDVPLGVGIAGIVVALGWAAMRVEWTTPLDAEPTRVALLQGNIAQDMKWRPERAAATLETYLALARSTDAALVLLPETALPMLNVALPADYLAALSATVREHNGDVLVGVPELDRSGRYFNSVMSFGTAPTQGYRKHHLVPFGDYFPLRPVLGWMMDLMQIPMSDFSHGEPVQVPLRVAGQKIAVNICYEDAFGEEVIRQLPEATLLANFTNDAWWGDSLGPEQHLQIAQLRALEAGRPMLRATNTGVTAIIDSKGRVVASAPQFVKTVVEGNVQGHAGSTPYVRWGNYGFLALSALMLLAAVLAKKWAQATGNS
jgi:apolipoprotein N-acyltransferase